MTTAIAMKGEMSARPYYSGLRKVGKLSVRGACTPNRKQEHGSLTLIIVLTLNKVIMLGCKWMKL
jgi:hypothetical protein